MKRLRNHLLFWALYVGFKAYLNITAGISDFTVGLDEEWSYYERVFVMQCSMLAVKVPLVYFSFYIVDRYLIRKWNLFKTVLGFITSFFVAIFSMHILNQKFILPVLFEYTKAATESFSVNSLLFHFFTLAFVVGGAVSARLLRRQYHSSMREVILQKEKVEAELKYLKSQINPHFLFNTLNNIYSLARKGAPETAQSVLELSKLMRFMLYNSGNKVIFLTEELAVVEHYMALERLRYTDRLHVTYKQELDDPQQRIAPLILVHFIENAFKHGASETRFESFITIDIKLKEGLLRTRIQNSKSIDTSKHNMVKPIGMKNIKRQLELIYPDHKLEVTDSVNSYQIDLIIPLNNRLC